MDNIHECECIIGYFYNFEEPELVTTKELKEKIMIHNQEIDFWKSHGFSSQRWELKNFCDFNINCGFLRFMYCPMCGKIIEWSKIMDGANE